MAYMRPPILTGNTQQQINAIRDYLFKLADSLDKAANAQQVQSASLTTGPNGAKIYKTGKDSGALEVQKSADELKALIIKSANTIEGEMDVREETYNGRYLAQSSFGVFSESLNSRIETTARGVVESYGYESSIESVQDSIELMQGYFVSMYGEIRRGIVMDPNTGDYVTGIAISQQLKFSGECGPTDQNNPGDGYTYYYLTQGQTFGLYTSTGWQFWIDGVKKGWFDSMDGVLHVANVLVENALQIGAGWKISSVGNQIEIYYTG